MAQNGKRHVLHWVVRITVWTFILAALLGIITQIAFREVESFFLAFLVLLIIVLIGIIFDIIGIAATAANEVPLLAKAAKKVPGAREALYLIRNADQFANFCNDVVGDIAGVISGVLTALLVLRLLGNGDVGDIAAGSVVLTALTAALTVGGKAIGKSIAINRSAEIIVSVAFILTKLERMLPGNVFFGRQLPPRRK